MVIGGPALTMWLTPTEEELFKRYNPDLQKRSLANREQIQADFDEYVKKLKEHSKSNKPSKCPPLHCCNNPHSANSALSLDRLGG